MSWAVNLAVVIVQRLTGILADAIKLRHLVVKLIGNINSPSLPVVQVIIPHCKTLLHTYSNIVDVRALICRPCYRAVSSGNP